MPAVSGSSPRPLTVVVWMLVIAILLIGGWKLFHLDHYSQKKHTLLKDAGKD